MSVPQSSRLQVTVPQGSSSQLAAMYSVAAANTRPSNRRRVFYCRGFNNYLYYFWGFQIINIV